MSPHTLGSSVYETPVPPPGFLRFSVGRRSPLYRYRGSPEGRDAFGGSRNGNRPAARANRERECRGRIVAPFRLAKPSAMAPSGASQRVGTCAPSAARSDAVAAGRDRISLTASAISSATRRLVALQRRERFAGRLRPDLGKYPLQELNARRERITIGVYGVGQ